MRYLRPFAVLVLALVLGLAQQPQAAMAAAAQFASGEIIVQFQPGAAAGKKLETHRALGGTSVSSIAGKGLELVKVPPGQESRFIERYNRNPNVLFAEPNFIRSIPEPETLSHPGGSEVMPGDYWFYEQYGLHNTGQLFYCILPGWCFYIGTPDADMDAPEAWAITMGDPSVRVAVIDTGIDYTHPDLSPNYVGGYDFLNGDSDPMDDHGHGTHVSGTVAAAMNNPTNEPAEEGGVVGAAPNVKLLAYKVCGPDGSCSDFAIQQAVYAAVDTGATVLNMSLGGTEVSQSLNNAIQDAWNAGVLTVAGAGNDGNTSLFYPAAYENVLAVGASDEDDAKAYFSNYGSWIEVAAPGNVIMSTYPTPACGGAPCYNWMSGTSMATPHVSGAAALVWSRPDVTSVSQVREILLESADGKGVGSVRLDSWTQHGRVNMHSALSYALGNTEPVADDQAVSTDEDMAVAITLTGTDADGDPLSYTIVGGPYKGTLSGAAPNVTYTPDTDYNGADNFTFKVNDGSADGNVATVSITVNPINDAPVAVNDSYTATAGVTLNVPTPGVLANDSDVDGPSLSAVLVDDVDNGTLTLNTDGSFSYTAASGFTGADSFGYQASDGLALSEVATVTITVDAALPPSAGTVHVADLDGVGVKLQKGTWKALITIEVQDDVGQSVDGYAVEGTVNQNGAALSFACVTGSAGAGRCTIDTGQLPGKEGKASFTVTNVSGSLSYDASANSDPDGDSDGTTIMVSK